MVAGECFDVCVLNGVILCWAGVDGGDSQLVALDVEVLSLIAWNGAVVVMDLSGEVVVGLAALHGLVVDLAALHGLMVDMAASLGAVVGLAV